MNTLGISAGAPHALAQPTASRESARARVAVQRRAHSTIRRHLVRSTNRLLVLVAADVGSFVLLREGIRALRDDAILGGRAAALVGTALPSGYLGGWQYAAALVIGLIVAGAYRSGDHRRDAARILAGVALATGLALWHGLWLYGVPTVLLQYVATLVVVGLGLVTARLIVDVGVARWATRVQPAERVVVVGDAQADGAKQVISRLLHSERMSVAGWVSVSEREEAGPELCMPRLGCARDIWDILHEVDTETVVLCSPLPNELFDLVAEATSTAGCRLLAVSRYDGIGKLRPSFVRYYKLPLVELTVPALRGHHLLLKRAVDLSVASVGLLVLAPAFVAIAVLIKLDSRGPVFFSQQRVGMGGRVFWMHKFRTMREGADEEKSSVAHLNESGDSRLFKVHNDPRITRVGAWLRRWSLDELPQLWDVLVGRMSLVGPRPFFESDLSTYSDHHFVRLGAKPGVTGLWQVNGRSSVVDFEEVVRMDREYIERWSAWLDLKILMRTPRAVLRRTGAY